MPALPEVFADALGQKRPTQLLPCQPTPTVAQRRRRAAAATPASSGSSLAMREALRAVQRRVSAATGLCPRRERERVAAAPMLKKECLAVKAPANFQPEDQAATALPTWLAY